MAVGTVRVYQHALEDIQLRLIDLASQTFIVALCSDNYTPSPQSDSSWAVDISAHELTTTGYAERTLGSLAVDRQSSSHVRWDAADITLSATSSMEAKWAVVYELSTLRPICYFDLEDSATSGINATQIVIQWPANGIFRYSNPA